MSEDDLLALVLEERPHLIRASMETEAYLSRLEQRHDELNELVERLFHDDSDRRGQRVRNPLELGGNATT